MSQSGKYISSSGPVVPAVETLTGNTGGAVPPTGGNINVVGSGDITVTGNPGTSTLTISSAGGTATDYDTDNGTAQPAAGVLDVLGDHGINTAGATNVVTIAIDNAITLGDLTPLAAGQDALLAQTGDITIDGGNLNLPSTLSADEGVISIGAFRVVHTFGTGNAFIGSESGNFTLTGENNTALGTNTLATLAIGENNTAVGYQALELLDDGNNNIAIGYNAGSNYSSTESDNILIGNAGTVTEDNTIHIGTNGTHTSCFISGIDGVDVGNVAKVVTMDGDQLGTATLTAGTGITITPTANVITIDATGGSGIETLDGNSGSATGSTVNIIADTGEGTALITGDNLDTLTLTFTDNDLNVVIGTTAFVSSHTPSTSQNNVGLGWHVLDSIEDGSRNVALGSNSLVSITDGSGNIGVGYNSFHDLQTGSDNIAINAGINSLVSGNNNIAIGGTSGSTYTTNESNNILINNDGVLGESNVLRIGTTGSSNFQINKTYIAAIEGVDLSTAELVTIDSDQLGSTTLTAGTNITITPGSGTLTISANPDLDLNYTNVNSSPYVVQATDQFLSVDCSGGAITVQLPNAPSTGTVFIIKDRTGSSATNNITVTTVGGAVNIDGATSFVMNTAYESINVIFGSSVYQVY